MKTILPGFFATLIFLSFGCQNVMDMKISYDDDQPMPMTASGNVKFKKSWQRWDMEKSPRLYDYFLNEPQEVNGIPCRGPFTLDESGALYGFILAEDHTLNGSRLPAGSRFEASLYRDGNRSGYMIFLPHPAEIQGYQVRHKGGWEDYKVSFYNDGSLMSFKTEGDMEINGIPCKGGPKGSDIILYPDGRLLSCYLSRDFMSGDTEYRVGTRILVDLEGRIGPMTTGHYLEIMEHVRRDLAERR
jgi:hypothetical protein